MIYKYLFNQIVVYVVFAFLCAMNTQQSYAENNKTLSIYLWEYGIDPDVIQSFEKEYDTKIVLNYYRSGDEMVSRLLSGPKGYDIVIVPDRFISVLYQSKILEKINKAAIPNLSNIAPFFTTILIGSEKNYAIPYLWGTLGIAYRTDMIDGEITTWDAVFRPDPSLKEHIALLDDARELIGAALKANGHSFNDMDEQNIKEACVKIEGVLPSAKGFYYDYEKENPDGDIWMAVTWNGIAYEARNSGKPIKFIVPEEGSNLWIDNFVIMKTAPNLKGAYAFADYVLDPKVSAKIANYTGFATPNQKALEYLDSDMVRDKGIYPSEDVLKRCEMTYDIGKAIRIYYNNWYKLRHKKERQE